MYYQILLVVDCFNMISLTPPAHSDDVTDDQICLKMLQELLGRNTTADFEQ